MVTTKCKEIDGDEVIASMDIISESKAHLLTFVCACGFNSNHKEYKRIDFLVKTSSDVNRWVELFIETESNIEMIVETTDKFKANKIIKLNFGLNEFITSSLKNLKSGLEELFQVECSNEELEKINQKLHSNELGLDFIYSKCKEDNWYNTAGKFARSNWNMTTTT